MKYWLQALATLDHTVTPCLVTPSVSGDRVDVGPDMVKSTMVVFTAPRDLVVIALSLVVDTEIDPSGLPEREPETAVKLLAGTVELTKKQSE